MILMNVYIMMCSALREHCSTGFINFVAFIEQERLKLNTKNRGENVLHFQHIGRN